MNHQPTKNRSVSIVFFIVIALAIIQVFVSNRLVSLDTKVSLMLGQTERLQGENDDLYEAVASRSAFLAITDEATRLGFTKNTRYLYLNHEQKVAMEKK